MEAAMEIRAASVRAACKHCRDPINPEQKCDECGKVMRDKCSGCHKELAHGKIPGGSVHIVGNTHHGLTPRQRHGLSRTGS